MVTAVSVYSIMVIEYWRVLRVPKFLYLNFFSLQVESNMVRCPDPEYAEKMIKAIDEVRVRGDSIGGVLTCIARNVPRVRIQLSS